MELTSFPHRREARHAVPWTLYRKEKGFLLAEGECVEDYLPFQDMAAHLRAEGDEALWKLLVQDIIKETTAIVLLEDFYGPKAFAQAWAALQALLSVYPKHILTPDLMRAMDTGTNGDLVGAAKTVARWHQRVECSDPGNQTVVLQLLPSVDHCIDAYPSYIRTALIDLKRILDNCDDFLEGAYLHGSLATLDFIPGSSDLDLVYVLNEETSTDARRLLRVRKRLKNATHCFYAIDPFQHHGPYVVTPKLKTNYIESYLPLAVWQRARPIVGCDEIQMSVRQSPFHSQLWFRRSVQHYRRCCVKKRYPKSLFEAKLLTSMASLLPTVTHTYVAGSYIDKPAAMAWLRHTFPEEFVLDWLDRITRIRSGNHFRVDSNVTVSGRLPDRKSKVSDRLQAMLTDAPYLRLAEVCDHILGVRNPVKPYARFKRLSNWPEPIALRRYAELTNKMARQAASIPSVTRLLMTGNVRTPGISDLDFLVVTGDPVAPAAAEGLNRLYDCLGHDEKAIVMHHPMGIVPEYLLPDLPVLFPLKVTSTLLGEHPVFHDLFSSDKRTLSLIHLTDLAIAMNGRLFQEMLLRKQMDVRLLLNQLGGLKYSIRLLKEAGGQTALFQHLLHDIETVRDQWFQNPGWDRLPGFLDRGVDLVNRLNESIHALWKRRTVFLPPPFSFRTPSTGVDFLTQEKFGCHIEAGEIVMHHPAIFGCTLLHYASQKGPLSQFISQNLNIPPVEQDGRLGRVLTSRAKRLNSHFAYLLSNGLKRGFFAPFHFGWQLWKEARGGCPGGWQSDKKGCDVPKNAVAGSACI